MFSNRRERPGGMTPAVDNLMAIAQESTNWRYLSLYFSMNCRQSNPDPPARGTQEDRRDNTAQTLHRDVLDVFN